MYFVPACSSQIRLLFKTPLNALYHSQSSQSSNVVALRTSQCGRKRLMTKFSLWQTPVFILRPSCFLTQLKFVTVHNRPESI